jgi:hypothetical protein
MMVGEKLRAYEEEADNATELESAQERLKKTMEKNFSAMKPLIQPSECCFRNTETVDQ